MGHTIEEVILSLCCVECRGFTDVDWDACLCTHPEHTLSDVNEALWFLKTYTDAFSNHHSDNNKLTSKQQADIALQAVANEAIKSVKESIKFRTVNHVIDNGDDLSALVQKVQEIVLNSVIETEKTRALTPKVSAVIPTPPMLKEETVNHILLGRLLQIKKADLCKVRWVYTRLYKTFSKYGCDPLQRVSDDPCTVEGLSPLEKAEMVIRLLDLCEQMKTNDEQPAEPTTAANCTDMEKDIRDLYGTLPDGRNNPSESKTKNKKQGLKWILKQKDGVSHDDAICDTLMLCQHFGSECVIYLWINLATLRFYVGQSYSYKNRTIEHVQGAYGAAKKTPHLERNLFLYKAHNFLVIPLRRFSAVESVKQEIVDSMECHFIDTLDVIWPQGYNISQGNNKRSFSSSSASAAPPSEVLSSSTSAAPPSEASSNSAP